MVADKHYPEVLPVGWLCDAGLSISERPALLQHAAYVCDTSHQVSGSNLSILRTFRDLLQQSLCVSEGS